MLRGARQVGKTWSVIDFGKRYFEERVHVVDLEQRPDWHPIFEGNLVAERILSELEILLNARIAPRGSGFPDGDSWSHSSGGGQKRCFREAEKSASIGNLSELSVRNRLFLCALFGIS